MYYIDYIMELVRSYLALIMGYVMAPYRYAQSMYHAVRAKGHAGMVRIENASTAQKLGAGGGAMLALVAIGGMIYYVKRR